MAPVINLYTEYSALVPRLRRQVRLRTQISLFRGAFAGKVPLKDVTNRASAAWHGKGVIGLAAYG